MLNNTLLTFSNTQFFRQSWKIIHHLVPFPTPRWRIPFSLSPKAVSCSSHLAHHVFAAKGIRRAENALRIIPPLAVHEEPVVMRARRQFHCGAPYPIRAFLQVDGTLLPPGKIPHQLHAQRVRRGECECLLPDTVAAFWICFFCHNLFFPLLQSSDISR